MLTPPTKTPWASSALSGAIWNLEDRSNIVASATGRIVSVGFDPSLGTFIVQTLPDGKYLSYSNLRAASVAIGEQVLEGENIATSGVLLHVVISDSPNGYKGEGTLSDPADYFGASALPVPDAVPDPGATITTDPVAVSPSDSPADVAAKVVDAIKAASAEPVPASTVVPAPEEPAPVDVVPVTTHDDPAPVLVPSTTPTTSTSTGTTNVYIAAPVPSINLPAGPAITTTGSNSGGVVFTPAPVQAADFNKIVADAVATPKSAAEPIAHQAKGAPVKGGLYNLISLPFWNDTLTRAFNTFLQVGLASVGAGATHIFTVSDITALKIAGGSAAISLVQSLIRATNQPAAK
jgi:hypothetical protein